KEDIIFLLWGRFAQDKQSLIDETKHHVLKAAHPSPFSADKGFFGCRHFSKANELLVINSKEPIDWKL
ncbi:MAG: uracil-DNA glycosylase, partial [Parafilimonas sp.]